MGPGKVCQPASTNGKHLLPESHGPASPTSASCTLDDLLGHQTALQELRLPHSVYLLRRRPKSLVSFSPARNYMYTFMFRSFVVAQHRYIEFNHVCRFHIDNLL